METYLTTEQHKGAPNKHTSTISITNNHNQNAFTNLHMREDQKEDRKDLLTPEDTTTETQSRQEKKQDKIDQAKHKGCKDNMKNSGIDSMLPTPVNPTIVSMVVTCNDEAEGGMDGGCQENHINLQKGLSKGGILPHVLHEGMDSDHSSDLRAPASNHNKGSIAKDLGSKASTSKQEGTPKSKNKPSKNKRDAAKKKQNMQQEGIQQGEQEKNEEVCKEFIMVDDQQGMDITPLQAQYMTPIPKSPPDKEQSNCQLNSIPIIDEYAVINSEDELDGDNQSFKEQDDEEETSEMLIELSSQL
ncbi:hypothetical protein R3W88_022563 [Solanum pinnatisectum]|uniref:Uncharacterized protein n=1 Tax=Solanum pinnatisectum TaxID=50273 RepID=A0AAV9LYC8_9SOLN|nr:hypothetical protein R3W88_022563 [Solanum pinnatisectum]